MKLLLKSKLESFFSWYIFMDQYSLETMIGSEIGFIMRTYSSARSPVALWTPELLYKTGEI